MAGTRQRAACPLCGKGFLERRQRSFWMRLLPGSKYYRCNWCLATYLLVFGRRIKLF